MCIRDRYCGGLHTCEVSVNNATNLTVLFIVTGVPPVGSRVMRGPSWNYNKLNHNYGEDKSDVATICHHKCLQDEKFISVIWQDGKAFNYKWDQNGAYDIQLFH